MLNCKKQCATLAAALFMVAGCLDMYDVPDPVWLESITVSGTSGSIPNNAQLIIEHGREYEYTTNVIGGDPKEYKWIIIGDAIVAIIDDVDSESSIKIKADAANTGSAYISVQADHNNIVETGFYVNINPPGVSDWVFSISSGGIDIPGGRFVVSPDEPPVFTLTAAPIGDDPSFNPQDVTFTVAYSSDIFTVSPTTIIGNGVFTIEVPQNEDGNTAAITVTARKSGDEGAWVKTFTAVAGISIYRPAGVLFQWSANPTVTRTIDTQNFAPNPMYSEVTLRARGGTIELTDKGIHLNNNNRLIIGGSAISANDGTNGTTHLPGVFDISEGSFTLTIDYVEPVQGTGYILRPMVNNNTEAMADSVLGGSCNLGDKREGDLGDGRLVLTLPSNAMLQTGTAGLESLKTAFVVLQCQGSTGSSIYIKGIKLEAAK